MVGTPFCTGTEPAAHASASALFGDRKQVVPPASRTPASSCRERGECREAVQCRGPVFTPDLGDGAPRAAGAGHHIPDHLGSGCEWTGALVSPRSGRHFSGRSGLLSTGSNPAPRQRACTNVPRELATIVILVAPAPGEGGRADRRDGVAAVDMDVGGVGELGRRGGQRQPGAQRPYARHPATPRGVRHTYSCPQRLAAWELTMRTIGRTSSPFWPASVRPSPARREEIQPTRRTLANFPDIKRSSGRLGRRARALVEQCAAQGLVWRDPRSRSVHVSAASARGTPLQSSRIS